jgi:hypothetical protein
LAGNFSFLRFIAICSQLQFKNARIKDCFCVMLIIFKLKKEKKHETFTDMPSYRSVGSMYGSSHGFLRKQQARRQTR